MNTLYLASGSPRRRELLTQIGVPFTVVSAAIDETPFANESAVAYVERLARGKAMAGFAALGQASAACVLGADTAVIVDGLILGKPVDLADALAMLMALGLFYEKSKRGVLSGLILKYLKHWGVISQKKAPFVLMGLV